MRRCTTTLFFFDVEMSDGLATSAVPRRKSRTKTHVDFARHRELADPTRYPARRMSGRIGDLSGSFRIPIRIEVQTEPGLIWRGRHEVFDFYPEATFLVAERRTQLTARIAELGDVAEEKAEAQRAICRAQLAELDRLMATWLTHYFVADERKAALALQEKVRLRHLHERLRALVAWLDENPVEAGTVLVTDRPPHDEHYRLLPQ